MDQNQTTRLKTRCVAKSFCGRHGFCPLPAFRAHVSCRVDRSPHPHCAIRVTPQTTQPDTRGRPCRRPTSGIGPTPAAAFAAQEEPCAFAFKDENLGALIMDKGRDIEEVTLEGESWISEAALLKIAECVVVVGPRDPVRPCGVLTGKRWKRQQMPNEVLKSQHFALDQSLNWNFFYYFLIKCNVHRELVT